MKRQALRDNLRLAATVTLVNGFSSLTGLPFALYASLAVLSVTVGNYGNTLELGRQRLVGTGVGAVVVFFGYRAWGHLPVEVALPLALLLALLIAGSLRLTVGYGVCCFVVVMGWLSHDQQLGSWIPLRLTWTAFGILMALLSLRLFWPSRARIQQREGLLSLLVTLGHTLQAIAGRHAEAREPEEQWRQRLGLRLNELRTTLLGLREQRQGALVELAPLAGQHPLARLWELLDQACEALILDLDELRRLPASEWQAWGLESTATAADQFVAEVAQRLLGWQERLRQPLRLPPPPSEPGPVLPVHTLQTAEAAVAMQHLSPSQLQRVASRLMVLNRIDHTLASTEQQWLDLVA
jgi:hypothetical protein